MSINLQSLMVLKIPRCTVYMLSQILSDKTEDVAKWLNSRFSFSSKRQSQARGAGVARNPESLYEIRKGYCTDAAYFAKESLNKINPEYKARLIYIDNRERGNNHWATGFYVNSELYVMDYGAGPNWEEMHGVHGPYKSLDEYHRFLASLQIPKFRVGSVGWNDGLHLSED